MNNKLTFTGAFLVKNPPYQAKKELENLAGRHKQIFENFDNTTDVFYVLRGGKDAKVAKFIKDNNLRFKFYPKINTKSGLDPFYPKNAVELSKKQSHVSSIDILSKMFKLDPRPPKLDLNVNGITQALGLKEKDLCIRSKKGITYAFTKDHHYIFMASPTNKNGENYVYLNTGGKYAEKYLIRENQILFKYPNNAEYFDENFGNSIAQVLYSEV